MYKNLFQKQVFFLEVMAKKLR